MGIFGRKKPKEAHDVLLPDGKKTVRVVGTSNYQDALDRIAGGKGEEPCAKQVLACLIRDPQNQSDSNAVAVTIKGRTVGHLARWQAAEYAPFLDALWSERELRATCAARVKGGWRRTTVAPTGDTLVDEGSYGVELDLAPVDELRSHYSAS